MAKKNEIQIIITAVDKASKALGGVGTSLEKLGKVGLIAGGAIAGIGAGIAAGAFALAKSAAPVEGIKNAFEGLTATMQGGPKKILSSLEDASYGMVKQSDLMASFNSAAQLVSKDFAQKMPDAMKYLAKVSAATGQDMGYMIDSMVKGVGRLSPMILDNLGVQVDLTEANEAYAASIGKSVGELTKQEQQTAIMNQVIEKLKVNTADMPEVAGSASQSFAELGAKFSNLKEEIGLRLLPLFQTIAQRLIELWNSPEIQAGVDNMLRWLDKIVGDESSGLIGIVSYLMAGNIQGAFDLAFGEGAYAKIREFFRKFGVAVEGIRIAIDKIKTAINDVVAAWDKLQKLGYIPGTSRDWSTSNQVSRWLGGFQSGGSFTVPGFGSGDRPYMVGFEPGETVSVTPKGHSPGTNLSLSVTINSAINLADRNYVEREMMPYIEAGVRKLLAA